MSLLTQWGYTITNADTLAAMLSDQDFNTLTASKFAGDARISPELAAACMGLRNYCGWHVYPVEFHEQRCGAVPSYSRQRFHVGGGLWLFVQLAGGDAR